MKLQFVIHHSTGTWRAQYKLNGISHSCHLNARLFDLIMSRYVLYLSELCNPVRDGYAYYGLAERF